MGCVSFLGSGLARSTYNKPTGGQVLWNGLPLAACNARLLLCQALKVYVPSFESYGRMWPHMHTRVVAALLLFQVTMLGYFLAKKFYYAPVLIPLPIITLIFAFVCRKKFYRSFQCTALEVVAREPKEASDMALVFGSFIPPSLQLADKPDEDQFEDASAAFSRSGSMV